MQSNRITSHSQQPFYLRRVFRLEKLPDLAELSVCGMGQYNAFLNGGRVGDGYLEPAWTDYDKLILYRRFDVTGLLREGKNALALEVGNGWYIWDQSFGYSFHFPPFMPPNPNPYHVYGESLVACFELTLRYADGTEERIGSDDECRTVLHGVKHTNVYGSEWIEGAALKRGCSLPDFDDSDWEGAFAARPEEMPKGRLEEAKLPPVERERSLFQPGGNDCDQLFGDEADIALFRITRLIPIVGFSDHGQLFIGRIGHNRTGFVDRRPTKVDSSGCAGRANQHSK